MSYTINKSNGNKLTEIVDGSIDQTACDLTLVGKNISNYGTFINDNFVWLLENFSNDTAPSQPLVGQLWYDTSVNLLKVYTGIGFAPTGNTIVSAAEPSSLNAGGLWVNSSTEQLFFNDGTNTILAGPIYTSAQGKSGFVVEDIIDTDLISHTIVKLFVANTLVGIYSKDATFTPVDSIAGYTTETNITISPGFNIGAASDMSYNLQAASALALVDSNGTSKSTDSFMSAIDDTFANGIVSFRNNLPAKFGAAEELQIEIGGALTQLKSNKVNQDIQLTTRRTGVSVYDPAIYMKASTQAVGIFTSAPTATLDVNGNTRIRGNLTVDGDTTTINSTTLAVDDLQIVIGNVDTPTDITANGGGFLLKGASDKTFVWNSGNIAWTSSENINLTGTRTYKISGDTVLSRTALGSTVASAPGLTSVGHLTTVYAGWISITNSSLSYVNSGSSDGTIYLVPKGTGTVDMSSAKVTHVATPATDTDAANKKYVDDTVKNAPLAISLNVGTLSNSAIASTYLNIVYPVSEHLDGTVCRVVATDNLGAVVIKSYSVNTAGNTWQHQFDYS
jgi:hypothetical protein